MEDLFRSYWWLLFPVMWFVFGAWDRWLSYRRSRDALDLIRTYTAQGKEPPPELIRQAQEEPDPDLYYREPRRRWRRYYRGRWGMGGPYWDLRRGIYFAVIAAAFWVASTYADVPGLDMPFRLVAIILGFVAAANIVMAAIGLTMREK